MLCSYPFRLGVAEFGCGRCMPCRINRKRLWTLRLMLEATQHEAALFVTLTYDAVHLPTDGSLRPKDVTDYLKRVRYHVAPDKVRYYYVGEYGERRGRPHYHVMLFGSKRLLDVVRSSWTMGLVHVGLVSGDSAGYVASYATKGMTKADDSRLNGRHPEFARMSRGRGEGGIGAPAMADVAKSVNTWEGARYVSRAGDVPRLLRTDGRVLPLGRYLSQRLRDLCGYDKPLVSSEYESHLKELQLLLRDVDARRKREGTRLQHGRIAEARERISRSKRVEDV